MVKRVAVGVQGFDRRQELQIEYGNSGEGQAQKRTVADRRDISHPFRNIRFGARCSSGSTTYFTYRASGGLSRASRGIAWEGDGGRAAFIDEQGAHVSTD